MNQAVVVCPDPVFAGLRNRPEKRDAILADAARLLVWSGVVPEHELSEVHKQNRETFAALAQEISSLEEGPRDLGPEERAFQEYLGHLGSRTITLKGFLGRSSFQACLDKISSELNVPTGRIDQKLLDGYSHELLTLAQCMAYHLYHLADRSHEGDPDDDEYVEDEGTQEDDLDLPPKLKRPPSFLETSRFAGSGEETTHLETLIMVPPNSKDQLLDYLRARDLGPDFDLAQQRERAFSLDPEVAPVTVGAVALMLALQHNIARYHQHGAGTFEDELRRASRARSQASGFGRLPFCHPVGTSEATSVYRPGAALYLLFIKLLYQKICDLPQTGKVSFSVKWVARDKDYSKRDAKTLRLGPPAPRHGNDPVRTGLLGVVKSSARGSARKEAAFGPSSKPALVIEGSGGLNPAPAVWNIKVPMPKPPRRSRKDWLLNVAKAAGCLQAYFGIHADVNPYDVYSALLRDSTALGQPGRKGPSWVCAEGNWRSAAEKEFVCQGMIRVMCDTIKSIPPREATKRMGDSPGPEANKDVLGFLQILSTRLATQDELVQSCKAPSRESGPVRMLTLHNYCTALIQGFRNTFPEVPDGFEIINAKHTNRSFDLLGRIAA